MDHDDILNIFDSDDEALLNEYDLQTASYDSLETIILKFLVPKSSSIELTSITAEINSLLRLNNIDILGMYWKGSMSVSIEAVLSSSLKSWLVRLFEERNNGPIISSMARNKILDICIGKFKLAINNTVISLVVLSGISCIKVPCGSSFPPYGVGNGDIINILAGKLADSPFIIIKKFLDSQINNQLLPTGKLSGIRVEPDPNCVNHFALRFVISKFDLSDALVKRLNKAYRDITYCSSTIHIVPKLLALGFEAAVVNRNESASLTRIVIKNDLISCTCSEIEILAKGKKNVEKKNEIRDSKMSKSLRVNKKSIFERLGKPVSKQKEAKIAYPSSSRGSDEVEISKRPKINKPPKINKIKSVIVRPLLN